MAVEDVEQMDLNAPNNNLNVGNNLDAPYLRPELRNRGKSEVEQEVDRPTDDAMGLIYGVDQALPFATGWINNTWEHLRGFGYEDDGPTVAQLIHMRNNSGQAAQIYDAIVTPIRSALGTSSFIPDEDGEKEAQFIEQMFTLPPNAGGMTTPFHGFISQLLLAVFDGFSAFEQIYWQPKKGPLKGKYTLQKLAYRPAETITFLTDKNGDFKGLRQQTLYLGETVDVMIPGEDAFFFTANSERKKFYGISMFRAAWIHWTYINKLFYVTHLAAQRHAVSTRIGEYPQGATKNQKNEFGRQLANVGVAQWMMCEAGFKVTTLVEQGAFDYLSLINFHNSQMSKSVLAAFLDKDQGGGGAKLVDFSSQSSDLFVQKLEALMDEIETAINTHIIPKFIDWNFGTAKYPTFRWGTFCITEDAEALTKDRGWVTHDHLHSGDIILSYDPGTKKTCWEPVIDVHRFKGTHDVISWKSNELEVVTTPAHRWLTEKYYNTKLSEVGEVRTTKELSEFPHYSQCVRLGSDGETDAFSENEIYSTDFVDLIGWFIAEGWYPKEYKKKGREPERLRTIPSVKKESRKLAKEAGRLCACGDFARSMNGLPRCDNCILVALNEKRGPWKGRGSDGSGATGIFLSQSQTKNPEKVALIRSAMSNLKKTWEDSSFLESAVVKYNNSTMITFSISGDLGRAVREVCGKGKQLSLSFLTSLTKAQAESLLKVLVMADGNIPNDRPRARKFIQQDQGRINSFVALCSMLGLRTSEIEKKDSNDTFSIRVLNRSRLRASCLSPQPELYTGTVWCPSLRTGFWVTRVNGRTFITGNTNEVKNQIRDTFNELAASGPSMNATPEFFMALEKNQAKEMGLDLDYTEIEKRVAADKAAAQALQQGYGAPSGGDQGYAPDDGSAPVDDQALDGTEQDTGSDTATGQDPMADVPVGLTGLPIIPLDLNTEISELAKNLLLELRANE